MQPITQAMLRCGLVARSGKRNFRSNVCRGDFELLGYRDHVEQIVKTASLTGNRLRAQSSESPPRVNVGGVRRFGRGNDAMLGAAFRQFSLWRVRRR